MAEPSVIFWDIGGVLLTNGWDREARRAAAKAFSLDWEEFQDRHDFVADSFERGETDLETYLTRTVFYRQRPFGREEFTRHIMSHSTAYPEALDLVRRLRASGRYVLATLNNESREINEHRIEAFGLRDLFHMFLSSCYLGVRKPDPEIYEMAIDIVQRPTTECLFIDDRDLNLECAVEAGIDTIHYEGLDGLLEELAGRGVRL